MMANVGPPDNPWKLALCRVCQTCGGTGFIQAAAGSHASMSAYGSDVQMAMGQVRCAGCVNGVQIKMATRKETMDLLRKIPNLVEDTLDNQPIHTDCDCPEKVYGRHYPRCAYY